MLSLVRLLGCLAIVVTFFTGCSEEPIKSDPLQQVRLTPVFQVDLLPQKDLVFPAEVVASEQASLSFRVPGTIKHVHVKSGAKIQEGDLLAELEPREYQALLDAKQAQYNLAKVQFSRSQTLIKDYLISQEQFDKDNTEFQVSENELNTAKTNLSYTKIYAPYSGSIGSTFAKEFEYSQALEPVMSIQSEGYIDIIAFIPERLVGPIKLAQKSKLPPTVRFSVNNTKEYQATFKKLETTADADSGAFQVTFTLKDPTDLQIYPGMAATVTSTITLKDEFLTSKLPSSAVFEDNNQSYVWLIQDDQTIKKVAVDVGRDNKLISGLKDSDRIVGAGAKELVEGQKVKAWVKEGGL